jgi:phage shock protein C
MEQKRLYKSDTNKMIGGVCGGIAEYINLDPTIVRLLWVVFSFAGGAGILAYIIAAIIIPNKYN